MPRRMAMAQNSGCAAEQVEEEDEKQGAPRGFSRRAGFCVEQKEKKKTEAKKTVTEVGITVNDGGGEEMEMMYGSVCTCSVQYIS